MGPSKAMYDDFSRIAGGIHRLSSVMGRITDRILQEKYDFGMTQFKIIWVLFHHREEGGVRQSDIATWLSQTEAAISRQMKPMTEQKLLESKVDPKNRRSHMVCLTAKGEELAKKAMRSISVEYRPILGALSEEERVALSAMLEKLFIKAVACADDSSIGSSSGKDKIKA